jgi:hypothetical protein
MEELKKCNKCGIPKELKYFNKSGVFKDGDIKYSSSCKECKGKKYIENKEFYINLSKVRYQDNKKEILDKVKKYQKTSPKHKEWRENNKNLTNKKSLEWYRLNKDKCLKNQKIWRKNNKSYASTWQNNNLDKVKKYNKKSSDKTNKEKPWVRIWRNQLGGVLKRLNQQKQGKTINELGYSYKQLKDHIESLWLVGMSWENYGGRVGCWEIDHNKPVSKFPNKIHPSIVNALDNLKPMWVIDNRKKGNKY